MQQKSCGNSKKVHVANMPKLTATESVTMGIRVTKEQRSALEKIAQANGVEVSQLIRWSVDALIEHVERCGGRLVLPIRFGEQITVHAPSDAPLQAKKEKRRVA